VGLGLSTLLCIAILTPSLCLAQEAPNKLTNQDIIAMVSFGLSDNVIIDKIHSASATDFDTSLPGLQALKAAKVSDNVIRAIINPHPAGATNSESSGVQSPPANADPNDPNSAHDPGIYIYDKTSLGMRLVMLEPTVYTQGKSGGTFASAMTYGIAKVKWKAVVRGAHANTRSSDPGLVFYFYTEEANPNSGHSTFGGGLSPNEFTLLKFDVKNDTRETLVMQANAFGSSTGTDNKSTIQFAITKLRQGVYKLTTSAPLAPGEYCFLSPSPAGANGPGAAGSNRLFDFGVTPPE